MRVGIIGGVERNQGRYEELAAQLGCEVEFHHGHMRGRGPEALDSMIDRCDLVVIVTEINSHCAVRTAQKQCRKRGRRVLIVRKFGLHAFEQAARAVRGEGVGPRVTTSVAQAVSSFG